MPGNRRMRRSEAGDVILSGFLHPGFEVELRDVSTLGLAHVGDAVFELMVRTWLCMGGAVTAKRLHSGAVEFVSARAQAVAAAKVAPMLSDEEGAVFKRGRNARVGSVPGGCSLEEYHAATGLEALFGYLYLSGRVERLEELFGIIVGG